MHAFVIGEDGEKSTSPPFLLDVEHFTSETCMGVLVMATFGAVSPLVGLVIMLSLYAQIAVQQTMIGVFLCRYPKLMGPMTGVDNPGRDVAASVTATCSQFMADCAKPKATLWESRHFLAVTIAFAHGCVTYDTFADSRVGWIPYVLYIIMCVFCECVFCCFSRYQESGAAKEGEQQDHSTDDHTHAHQDMDVDNLDYSIFRAYSMEEAAHFTHDNPLLLASGSGDANNRVEDRRCDE